MVAVFMSALFALSSSGLQKICVAVQG